VVAGFVLARLYMWFTSHIRDIPISVVLQFIGTFAVWLLADALQLSAIITVIAYAMTLSRHAPGRTNARRRIASYAVWEVAVFVLNVLAFVLIGLQLRMIMARMHDSEAQTYLLCALGVCVTVILVRIVWVMGYNVASRWRTRRYGCGKKQPRTLPTVGGGLVIAWCGMRGIVTLAAALALPDGSPQTGFPYRDLIILCAFCVVLTTLVLQGMTLGPLLRWTKLKDDGQVEREIRIARAETAKAALRALDGEHSGPLIERLRNEYEARARMNDVLRENADGAPNPSGATDPWQQVASLSEIQRRTVRAQRDALVDLRARSIIGDDAFHAAEEEIDLLELRADERIQSGDLAT
jgi:CPA1 family monovalent cation:H+ antiporter